jgi:hypothetical protein
LAGLIVLFEFLIWPRKKVRSWQIFGSAQVWMRAHIWLGLLSLPLAILHTGFRVGGHFNATFLILFVFVIVSGVFGLLMQNLLPKYLLRHVPAETVYGAIPDVSTRLARDAEQLVLAACGDRFRAALDEIDGLTEEPDIVVVGEIHAVGALSGRKVSTVSTVPEVNNPELLFGQFNEKIRPFLVGGKRRVRELSDQQRADAYFQALRSRFDGEATSVVDDLEQWCHQRRQFDTQIVVHWWLHGWLAVHAGLSVAVLIMLTVHVWFALKYL